MHQKRQSEKVKSKECKKIKSQAATICHFRIVDGTTIGAWKRENGKGKGKKRKPVKRFGDVWE